MAVLAVYFLVGLPRGQAAATALLAGQRQHADRNVRIVDLRPGPYTVTFTLTGFNTFRRTGIELRAEFTATVDAELQLGTVEETITVTADAPLIETSNASTGTVLDSEALQTLPSAGRAARRG